MDTIPSGNQGTGRGFPAPESGPAGEQSALIRGLLARMAAGDPAARHELIACAYQRLRCLAGVILNESFPRLKAAPTALETTDVANEAALGMYQVLAEIQPETPRDFFRLAAQRIRWLLLDRAKQLGRACRQLPENPPQAVDRAAEASAAPSLEALYQHIDNLPDKEREVVDLLYFHGLSQVEAAAILGVTERSVRRYWTAARLKLLQDLPNLLPLASVFAAEA
jgi:RNA polymerase sigma factor (TIGR02999 family)